MPCYIIALGDLVDGAPQAGSPVKIGWSGDSAERRLRALQTAHHERLSIVRLIEGSQDIELWMHARFAARRLRNEWFGFCQEMLSVQPPADLLWEETARVGVRQRRARAARVRFPTRWNADGQVDWSRMLQERTSCMPGATEAEVFRAWREQREVPPEYRHLFPSVPDPIPPLNPRLVSA